MKLKCLNLKEAKALVKKYRSLTIKDFEKVEDVLRYIPRPYTILQKLTGFDSVSTCTLCQACNACCSECIYRVVTGSRCITQYTYKAIKKQKLIMSF